MSRPDSLRARNIDPYPARSRRTHTIKEASVSGDTDIVAAGRLIVFDAHNRTGALEDETGRLDVVFAGNGSMDLGLFSRGDLIECHLHSGRKPPSVTSLRLLAPALRDQPETFPGRALEIRSNIMRLTRRFFEERGYLEVETPNLMRVPELTPALKWFSTIYCDEADQSVALYLQASPEHYMKRMLAGGYERIYQICRFFRNGERYPAHNPEFTGLEWYQAYADYHEVMATTEELIASMAVCLTGSSVIRYQGRSIDLGPPWPRRTVRDALLETARIDLEKCRTQACFFKAAAARGIPIHENDSWDDVFHQLSMQYIEPAFPPGRPLFLTEYPAQLPSLAKRTPDDDRFVERFELYIGGLELANAFTELNDPVEQRARFEAQRRIKQAQEGYAGGLDEALLAALEWGMPPAGGIALGMDRLIMLFADAATIDAVLAFPF